MSSCISIAECARANDLFSMPVRRFNVRVVVDGVPCQFDGIDADSKRAAMFAALGVSGLSVLDFSQILVEVEEV